MTGQENAATGQQDAQKGGYDMYSRQKVVDYANSQVGKKESDGSYKSIIDTYNTLPADQLPRRTRMQYGWAWCACFWSAIAVALKYLAIMPIEISCYYLIEAAKKLKVWQENDAYIPAPGDAVLYDWDDSGQGDNTGNPDHVGAVTYVNTASGYMVVTEGNYGNAPRRSGYGRRGQADAGAFPVRCQAAQEVRRFPALRLQPLSEWAQAFAPPPVRIEARRRTGTPRDFPVGRERSMLKAVRNLYAGAL